MHNVQSIPSELRDRNQWLLWSNDSDPPKAPQNAEGYNASWTDPGEWMTYDEARQHVEESEYFDGVGFVIAESDPYIGLDLDGILEEPNQEKPKDWVPALGFMAGSWAEYSGSGYGIHIIVKGDRLPEWWADSHLSAEEHEGVEAYTQKFFALTGDKVGFAAETINEINVEPFLSQAYEAINGEAPTLPGSESEPDTDVEIGIYDVISQGSYPEGENNSHPFHPSDTGTNFRVDPGGSTFRCWRHSVTGNGAHLLGIEQGVIECGEWSNGGLSSDTWKDIFEAGREAGYDIPEPRATDGGATAMQPSESGQSVDTSVNLDPLTVVSKAGYDPDNDDSPGLGSIPNSEVAYSVVELLYESDNWHFRWVSDTDELYAYKDGIWHQGGDQVLRAACRQALRNQHTKHLYNEITHQLLSHPVLRVDRDNLGSPEGTIAVENGLLDLKERTIRDLRPDDMAIRQLPTPYDPGADYGDSRWLEFLEDSVRDGDLEKLQEYAGYVLWHKSQPFGKALFLLGPTDSGKGTFLRVIEAVIGEENVANQSLFDLMQSRFGPAELFGNVANIRNEVTPGGIKNVERFKEMTGGGDRISAEKKGQDPFQFTVTQKFLFATNQVPEIQHAGEPFYNRLLFVGFPETVPPAEQDPRLDDKLLEERSAILNWMLDGLDRLFEQNGFTDERSHEAKRDLTDKYGNLVRRFKHNMLEVTGDGDDVVHKGDLHQLFKEYAEYVGKSDVPQQSQFTKKLKNIQGITDGQSRRIEADEGDRAHVYKNIRVTQEFVETIGAEMPRHATSDSEGTNSQQYLG